MTKRKMIQAGFSLLEVLVAATILALGALFMFGMFPASALGITDAQNIESGTEFAREKLEYWIQQGYTAIHASPATLESGVLTMTGKASGAPRTWSFRYQITHAQISGNSNIEQVEAYVTWVPPSGLRAVRYQESVRLDSWVTPTWVTP